MIKGFTTISCLLLCLCLSAQNESRRYEDFESWNSIEIVYKYSKTLSLSASESIRFKNNTSDLDNYFTQIALDYEPTDWLSLGTAGRYTIGEKLNSWRWSPIVQLGHRIKSLDLDLSYRIKQDWEWDNKGYDYRIRNRFKVKHKKKKNTFRPSLAIETFSDHKKHDWDLFRMRYLADLEIQLGKKHSIDIGYYLQRSVNSSSPDDAYILSISYTYEL